MKNFKSIQELDVHILSLEFKQIENLMILRTETKHAIEYLHPFSILKRKFIQCVLSYNGREKSSHLNGTELNISGLTLISKKPGFLKTITGSLLKGLISAYLNRDSNGSKPSITQVIASILVRKS